MNTTTMPTQSSQAKQARAEDPSTWSPGNLGDAATGAAKEVRDAATQLKDAAAEEAHRLGDVAKDFMRSNVSTIKDLGASLKEEAALASDRTQAFVREDPVKAVLIAAAGGAAIAALIMLASRRH